MQAEENDLARQEHEAYIREQQERQERERSNQEKPRKEKKKSGCIIM